MLGSEAPVDDIPREIEILNQVVQDPTIDGLIITTPQAGAYNDIVKRMLDKGIPVATTNSLRRHDLRPHGISHTGQDAAAAAIGGEALAKCVLDKRRREGLDHLPAHDDARQCRGQQPHHRRLHRDGQDAERRRQARQLQGRRRAGEHRHRRRRPEHRRLDRHADREPRRRGRHLGRQRLRHARDRRRGGAARSMDDKICAFGFDLGPKQQEHQVRRARPARWGSSPSCRASGR